MRAASCSRHVSTVAPGITCLNRGIELSAYPAGNLTQETAALIKLVAAHCCNGRHSDLSDRSVAGSPPVFDRARWTELRPRTGAEFARTKALIYLAGA